jgi:hypothetical protein
VIQFGVVQSLCLSFLGSDGAVLRRISIGFVCGHPAAQ